MARMLLLAFLAAASSSSSYSSAPLASAFTPRGLRPAEYRPRIQQPPTFVLEPPPPPSSSAAAAAASTILFARVGSDDNESTPAERHKEAVAASQLEARKRRGEETTTPAERHRAVVAASQAAARLKRGEGGTPAEKHGQAVEASRERARHDREERQAAAKLAFDGITSGLAESFVSTAKAFAKTDDDLAFLDGDELPQSKDVDAGQLNKLLVHAEKILADSDAAIELLGGPPTSSLPDCRVLSQGPSQIMGVGGGSRGKSTEGIRAFLEVKGPKRSGMATVVGDKRGVLLMKLTVGGQTVELKSTEGLNEAAAHGTVKTTSTKKKKGGPWP